MHNPTVAIILSRQPLGACANSSWVKASLEAIKWVKKNNYTLLTSVEIQTWELLLFCATKYFIPCTVVIPSLNTTEFNIKCEYYTSQFLLNTDVTRFVQIPAQSDNLETVPLRDKYVIESADIIIPVAIRKNGVMSRLLSQATNKTIIRAFSVPYTSKSGFLKQTYSQDRSNNEIVAVASGFLFHWTRASSSPWPGETLHSFYNDIVHSQTYPRDAFDTLDMILSSRKLIGSSRHMPKGFRCVSFTAKNPVDFIAHMRWRSRYSQMSFEPYGVGIRTSVALRSGIKKVNYRMGKHEKNSSDNWLHQTPGIRGDWQSEEEFRCNGDFDFTGIDRKDLLIICKSKKEAVALNEKYKISTAALFDE